MNAILLVLEHYESLISSIVFISIVLYVFRQKFMNDQSKNKEES
jgi:hypothetical protein